MKSYQRPAHKVWATRHHADGASRTTHIEIAFECSGGSPRFPSFLLSIETARILHDELTRHIARVNGETDGQ